MSSVTRRQFLQGAFGAIVTSLLPEELELPELDCPILYFHEIVNPQRFIYQVAFLMENGWDPISLSDLMTFFQTGRRNWRGSPFILSFDDGLFSQKRHAFPVLCKNGIPAVFSVMPSWDGDGVHKYMSNREIKELADCGIEIASHTFTHANLPRLRVADKARWEVEIVQSKHYLEDIIGRPVDYFCYPYGSHDGATVRLVSQHYKLGLSTLKGSFQRYEERYLLRRQARN